MGAFYEEFARELDRWRSRFAGRPRAEINHLLLLSLEREGMVTVAYREELMLHRLEAAPLSPEARELIHHALLWAWKDEEMHTVYLRGALLKLGSRPICLRALLRQAVGITGGWASSVRQHVRWHEAPLSRTLATLITTAGTVAGQVPREIREHLRYRPFREFCRLNVDAERTAWLCYERLLQLAREHPEVFPTPVEDIVRIQADESRHERIFEVVGAALDEQDGLAPEATEEGLAARIAEIGDYFLPRARRGTAVQDHPLGRGGEVRVAQGAGAAEKLPLFRRLLEEAGLRDEVLRRAEQQGKEVSALRVVIKPTFMMGYHRKDRSPITDPELLHELAVFLHDCGCRDLVIAEARNIYDRFYQHRSVAEVARYFGIESPLYRIVDLSEEQAPYSYARGLAQNCVGESWRDGDLRISFGKLRTHPVEGVSLAIGNLEGIGARCDEFFFAERQAHRDTALMMLLDAFPPHFSLLDGYDQAADGLVGIMGCPCPPSPRRLYAGLDPLSVDLVAARHLHLREPGRSPFLRAAGHWFGDPAPKVRVIGPDTPLESWRDPSHNEWATLLSLISMPIYRYGSCRGALFVPEMDTDAFPPHAPEPRRLQAARRAVQALLGLRFSGRAASDAGRAG
ncbi:MAG TPA: DUF362 domain-containing protein [Armatimonadota bacterium]|nr:DUF362 domain-containing protein [Armatimonadota bacterium]